jgi:hypothetical protein
MRAALLLLAGCSQVFGLHEPSHAAAVDASADGSAAGCVTQAECPTSVCLPDGSCAADDDVAWLDGTGTSNMACTMAQPCTRVADALATNRPYWRVRGTITQLSQITRDVTIFTEPGGTFSGGGILYVSAALTAYDLTLDTTCVQIMASGSATLERVTVEACSGYGISAVGALTLDRSTIRGNRNGGVILPASGIGGNVAQFTITNNFIVGNNPTLVSNYGGVAINATSIAAGSRLELNTIAENVAKSSTAGSGGVTCDFASFTASGNLIVHNIAGSETAANANTSGQCVHAASIIQTTTAGIGFVDPAAGNYHLTAGSPAIDYASLTSTVTDDVDGESRPNGAGYDVGADELH